MAKLTLNDVVAGYKATTAINANSAATEAAMENTLSRDGTSPNTMTADLDMNGNAILNSSNILDAVSAVTGTAPIVVSAGLTPVVSVTAATTSAAGSLAAADKTKLDALSGTNTGDQTVGTIATQDANAVNIDGGNIDGTVIGAASAAAVSGTAGSFTGSLIGLGASGMGTASPLTTAKMTVKQQAGGSTGSTQLYLEQSNVTDGYGMKCDSADGDLVFSRYASSAFAEKMRISKTGDLTNSGTIVATGNVTGANLSGSTSGTNTGDQTNITGNAATVSTNANLTGHVTSVGNASTLNSFTSTELRGAITDETGTGVAVFATSPTLITPVLGTPASGNLANCTFPTLNQSTTGNADTATLATNVTNNANLTGHVTSVGNAAVLGSFTSAQLATALTNETGSGAAVFGTSPTMASPTMTGTVTVPTPSNNTDAATKAYVDTIKQGSIDIKDSVRVASTANIAIASALTNGSTIDGVTVATGNRVLLKDQSDASENGIYAVVASGAASRTVDANTNTLVTSGMYTYVAEGTAGNSIGFVLTTADPITLDTTNLTFTQFSSAGAIAAGTGMTKTSNTLDVIGTSGRIVANANSIDIGSDVALVANPLSQFGATTSLQLKGVLSDETGSGAAVFATSPTLVTPALGTPASGVVTNLTGTASININGTVGAGTPATVAATTVSATSVTASGFVGTGATDAIKLPVGTTAQQPTPATGMLRFNTTDTSFEGYDGAEWGAIGGGGGDGALGFSNNVSTVVADYTLATGNNASSVGPMTVATGVTVTLSTGSRWVIL